jgi:thioesterase domain-containing protein
MAGLLAGGKPSEWSSVVPIRTGSGEAPLFLIHAVGGNAIGFGPLADRLPGYDVYGIQAWGLHPRHFPHLSVEEMAAHYIGEMKGIQPEGPYRVAGYSFGGVVAYEMARQLEAAGEDVAFLGLLDRRALVTTPRKGVREAILRAWNRSTRRFKLAIRIPLAKALLAVGLPVPFMHRIATGAIKRMGIAYRPGVPYGGDVDLFLVEPRGKDKDDPVQAWSPHVAGKIRSHAVPGTHNTMLEEPHVEGVAEALRKAIGDARGPK